MTTNPRFTTVVRVERGAPPVLRLLRHGPVSLAMSQATAAHANGGAVARMLRSAAQQVVERARLDDLPMRGLAVSGTADIARAVVTLAGGGRSVATLAEVRTATETLATSWVEAADAAGAAWIQPMLIGAAVLGELLAALGAHEITLERLRAAR
ncbi:MAG TPA: hypothetical protein VHJ20_14565 [Polyangia bacterium]|nr:hypothetical protein [Polyangia bacterium]